MNVIEKYAERLGKLDMDFDLFAPDAVEMCPGEGLMDMKGYQKSLKRWFPFLDKIVIKKIVCKSLKVKNSTELHGIILFDVYYKVKKGEAKVDVVHVLKANEHGKVLVVNSFWAFPQFEALLKDHPELKQVFDKEDHKRS